ncbi:hypothetical protein G5V58_02770 [Nocardioides anomalus]|uniref:PBP domain-containing protein n=1 Tax=Nocardioides anomalus TaxID=2712223 RepID=A0A6G6W9R6_9ACTN|nr:substrate-binding domain-containing protein [Nocardioides anomalus]QIG41845.1 hypothetical protein G5V58_02770 [Nocardioides anomalus]
MSALSRRSGRRSVLAGSALALGAALVVLPAPAAHAATPFVVIGTSDVSDSNLVASVIEPRFEAAYPQYDLQYIAKGTGAALTDARNGLAAAAIVHAASIENQFVADGYSLEPYGRLVFWGDYVLLGPNDDPAGVAASAPNDIVAAFEKVAAAGAAGKADFVSRGGTPGTAVQERALWALTSGVATCAVGAPAGGGTRPKDPASPSTQCTSPDDTTPDPDGAPFPTWYHTGNAGSQATNVNIANTCSTATNPSGKCYVFTDRGTYKYLRSTGQAQNLKIVTRDNSSGARGGRDALINVFHAYAVNPAKFADPSTTKTDPVAAKLFLDFLTSPATQSAIGAHLASDGDAAFVPSASPQLSASFASTSFKAGRKTTITGTLANAVPGYPALGGVTVSLQEFSGSSPLSVPKTVKQATTDATGAFSMKYRVRPGKVYRVGTAENSKVELPNLNPPFGDLLAPASSPVGTASGVALRKVVDLKGPRVKVTGDLKPKPTSGKAKVTVYAAKKGQKLKKVGRLKVKDGKAAFSFTTSLPAGTWRFQVLYKDGAKLLPATSKTVTVKVS